MKLTFIVPEGIKGIWSIRYYRMPPLGLLRLASSTPREWDVEIIDEKIEKINYETTDLVAITAMTSHANRAYKIADRYRKKGIKVILGGVHPSMMPEEAIKHADSVVIGEADFIWKDILKDFKNNKLKRFYEVKDNPDISKIPLIRRELIKNKYPLNNLIQTSRGCPFGCDFCSVSKFSGRKIRHRPLKDVLTEIKSFKGLERKYFFFADDNIAADPKYAKELFKAMKPLKVRWASQSSIIVAKDDELLKLAKESGCKALFIGFESISQDSVDEIHKAYKVEEYKEMIKKIHDHGISIIGAFIFGFDNDKKDVFEKTVEFCKEVDLDLVQFTPLTPLPGTKLYERLKKEKRIIVNNWDYYDVGHAVFKPKNMTREELQEGISWCFDNFYTHKSILKKFFRLLSKRAFWISTLVLYVNYQFRKGYKIYYKK